jgi:hypothetical protein
VSRYVPGDVDPSAVDPDYLALLLARYGWTRRGGRDGVFAKWDLPDVDERTAGGLIVPLDPTRGDYNELLADVVRTLDRLAISNLGSAQDVMSVLLAPGDEVRFTKAMPTRRGAVPWNRGEEVFTAAKATMVAAAKSRMSRRAFYGNTHGTFAKRFLDQVLMGQTDVGSFVVTAFTPPELQLPESPLSPATPNANVAVYTGRDVTQMLAESLQAARAAASTYHRDQRPQIFEEAVPSGVSRELVEALAMLALESDGAEVRIEWAPSPQMALIQEETPTPIVVEFSASDAVAFQRASPYLSSLEPTVYVRIIGWVSVVSRPAPKQAGVVRVRVVAGSDARTVQVRLSEEQFEVAARAVSSEQGIAVSGRQERDGARYWLYDVTDIRVLDLPSPEAAPGGVPKNQLALLDDDEAE